MRGTSDLGWSACSHWPSCQGNTKFVFQGVHEQINFGPSSVEWAEGEKRMNRMVFIGRNLNRKAGGL